MVAQFRGGEWLKCLVLFHFHFHSALTAFGHSMFEGQVYIWVTFKGCHSQALHGPFYFASPFHARVVHESKCTLLAKGNWMEWNIHLQVVWLEGRFYPSVDTVKADVCFANTSTFMNSCIMNFVSAVAIWPFKCSQAQEEDASRVKVQMKQI